MEKEEKFKELSKRNTKCIYYDYELNIVDETETTFILNNGDGESVAKDNETNIQFMLIKDTLGFEQIDKATFQKEVSKFDEHLKLKALKLVFYNNWLVRVVQEKDDRYFAVVCGKSPDNGWYRYDNTYMKWISKSDSEEIQPFISYWKNHA